MNLAASVAALGDHIAAAWLRAGRAPQALPDIAAAALADAGLHQQLSVDGAVRWALGCAPRDFPRQADPAAQFGDPPLTLWRGTQLRIDLLLWLDSAPDIHDHAFSGAFQVISGASLQGTYAFSAAHTLSPDLRIGALSLRRLERLSAGDVRPIAPGSGLIHSLFHLHRPSATLVVRTEGLHGYMPQSIYLPPGIASASYPAALHEDPLYQRRLQLLVFLQRTGDPAFGEALVALLDDADPLQAVGLLGYVFDALALGYGEDSAAAQLSSLIDGVVTRYPALTGRLLPVFRRAHQRKRLVAAREQVHHPDGRTLLAMLLYAPDRATLDALDADGAWLHEAVGHLAGCGLPGLETPDHVRTLRALMRQQPPDDGAIAAAIQGSPILAPLLTRSASV